MNAENKYFFQFLPPPPLPPHMFTNILYTLILMFHFRLKKWKNMLLSMLIVCMINVQLRLLWSFCFIPLWFRLNHVELAKKYLCCSFLLTPRTILYREHQCKTTKKNKNKVISMVGHHMDIWPQCWLYKWTTLCLILN